MTGISKHGFNTQHIGMSVFMLRLAILLFLGSLALVRKAQEEFYNNDEENPLRGLFEFQSGSIANMKDSFDDVSCLLRRQRQPIADIFITHLLHVDLEQGNIQKVIGILQGNIKQWSFIESQLLEPNVNLGMVRAIMSERCAPTISLFVSILNLFFDLPLLCSPRFLSR